jgi:DNA-binding response OmpR family regulator
MIDILTRRPRVLVVEDEWLIADMLEEALRESGFEVAGPAPTVKRALELLAEGALDAAVLDVSLNREPSFPVAEALAERGVPFVFMTGYAEADLPVEFRSRPILHKPFAPEALTSHVSRLLERTND